MTETKTSQRRDDLAYLAPMAIYMVLVGIGNYWAPLYVPAYFARMLLVPIVLLYFWRHYAPIRWTHLSLGALVGIIGVVQWVGMEKLLQHLFTAAGAHHVPLAGWVPYYGFFTKPLESDFFFDPFSRIHNPAARYAFIAVHWAGATLVVPVMEELFWRDYLWRNIYAPANFKMAAIGDWDWMTVVVVALAFCLVHPWWITAIVWALLIAWLLIHTRSLGACIVAHGVTNFLLAMYVLIYRDWVLW